VFLQNSFSYDIPEAKPGTVKGYLSRYIGLEVFFVLPRAQKDAHFVSQTNLFGLKTLLKFLEFSSKKLNK
jgi:hypothetical protein